MMGTILNNHTALRKGDERLPMWKWDKVNCLIRKSNYKNFCIFPNQMVQKESFII
jgi:hypothetical protein